MNLNFMLAEHDLLAAQQAVGETIVYCVPADLSLAGRRMPGFLVIGQDKWAYVEDGEVRESRLIAEASNYKIVPLIGNAVLEAEVHHTKRIIVRVTMQHAARYGFIAQILNDMAAERRIRIFNNEEESVCVKCGGPLVHGTRVCPKCMSKAAAFKRLFMVSQAHWKKLALGLVVLFASSGISLTGPFFQKLLINGSLQPPAGQSADRNMFYLAIAGMLLVLVLGELLVISRGRIMAGVSSGIAADLRKMVFDKTQQLSLGFLTSQRAGDIMNRITSDTDRIRHLIQELCTTAIFQLIMLVSASYLLFHADWRLAVVVLIPAPIVALLHRYIWKTILWKLFHKQWRVYDKANSFLHDVLSGIRVVKAFGKEDREIKRFRDYNSEFAAATVQSERLFSILSPITNYLIELGQYLVLMIGCGMIIGKQMNIGELIQFSAYASMIFGPIAWLMFMPRWVANAVISIDRVFSVIDEQPEVLDVEVSENHPIQGTISFKDVIFGYKTYEPVLKQLNFEVKQGEMIGLVGHSGSGKSTLINLVSRFYDVTEGEILIDGVDIRSIKQEDLRSQIGVVLQETFLFTGTIMENIRYSKPDASHEEIIQAARVANAHNFIINFPDGYDTMLDENGNNLSGGERQRIAIARAVLNNPRILILDEATASLDIDTEMAIQEALQRVTKNRTTIAIAHRLSTLRHADRLLVLEKGEVAEVGTHTELLEKKGIYYNLIHAQRDMTKPKVEQSAESIA
ncbi:ABC transporter [Paenibacillus baekrokdamisoli]|uniref:ABC transporter n=1 Tax=Paenibacillus baekrokdamisoli TaxID=1712516 RepID=A0A3G9IUA7_9BACL|nr:ABC transporter ATP-binding protein [Paenibacillus baekrokdamisoli]MBB3072900.1 ATP-binding cassette subfamily B protein [Paenibacillus baekrokdamisoli]BBH21976.1 ABC transporter [Paenibacillus baekrokdamisoli]